ncbi:MAG: cell division protein ZapA [Deltaproteobacteria bacterium]|nr:cell division protein ZapA [Deltaproteobacteria bacterium]
MYSIKVKILDHEYRLKSDESEEHVRKIAEYVNQKLQEIGASSEGLSEKKMAILAALHIAGDYFQATRELELVKDRIRKRTKDLVDHIDSVMMAS